MSLGMGLGLHLEPSIQLRNEIKLYVKPEISLQLSASVEALREGGEAAAVSQITATAERICERIQQPPIKAALRELFKKPELQRVLYEQADHWLRCKTPEQTEHLLQQWAVQIFYRSYSQESGKVTIPMPQEQEDNAEAADQPRAMERVTLPVLMPELIAAYQELLLLPDTAEDMEVDAAKYPLLHEMILLKKIIEADSHSEKTIDTRKRFQEMENAFRVVQTHGSEMNMIRQLIQLAMRCKDSQGADGKSILGGTLMDLAVQRKFDSIVSSRMLRRFAERAFSNMNKTSTRERFETSFLNTVGEYVLVSMGVVHPELFVQKKANVDYEDIVKSMEEIGLPMRTVLERYKIKTSGTIFWNRWSVCGRQPTRVTDEQIQQFITKTVRKAKERLLQAARYSEFYDELHAAVQECDTSDEDSVEIIRSSLHTQLATKLNEPDFRDTLKQLIKQWYPELQIFFREGSTPVAQSI